MILITLHYDYTKRWPIADVIYGKLEGFVVDLMNALSSYDPRLDYFLYFSNEYGGIEHGRITGMLREVYDHVSLCRS